MTNRFRGMQTADLKTGQIITASVPDHSPLGNAGLLHGIGWTPDQTGSMAERSGRHDPHVYVWDMTKPMAPVLKARLALRSGHGSHWLTFDIQGRLWLCWPEKNNGRGTEIFSVADTQLYRCDRGIGRHAGGRFCEWQGQSGG